MGHSRRSPAFAYLVAILATLMVALVRLGFWEWFGDHATFTPFLGAVTLAAWYGGRRPGLLATVLSLLVIDYTLLPPQGGLLITSLRDVAASAVFLGIGAMISHLGEGVLQLREQQRQNRDELAREREAEEQLALAQAAGRMGSWQWDLRTNRLDWSAALEVLHGLEPGTFPRTLAAYQVRVHPDDRHMVLGAFEDTLRHSGDFAIEYRITWPDDTVRWVEGRGRLFRDSAGAPDRMIGVCIDIT